MNKVKATTPDGEPKLTFNYTKILKDYPGVTVLSAVVTALVHPASAVPDPSPANRLRGSYTIIAGGMMVQQFGHNWIDGVDYIFKCLATLSDTQIEPMEIVIPIRSLIDVT